MSTNQWIEIKEGLRWLGIKARPEDCDLCEDGSVYYGLTMVLAKGTLQRLDNPITPNKPTSGGNPD